MDFQDKVAVVTGSAGGIGLAIVTSLAARGARVVLADLDGATAEAEAERLRADGHRVTAIRVDVADATSVQALADAVFSEHGRVDILVNNAGVALQHLQAMWTASHADFRWLMDVNYHGVVNGLLAFVPRMREQEGLKVVVNTSSMATLRTPHGHSMYAASKAAVDALTACLRAELADQGDEFDVVLLHPGPVRTRIKTSERYRDDAESTEGRAVADYAPNGGYTYPVVIEDPAEVGEMLVRALVERRARCLTHPAPSEELRRVLGEVEAGYAPA